MGSAPAQSRVVKFGVFEADLEAGELRKSGMRQKLAGQPFQVLQLLLEHPQHIVTHEELQQRIWPQGTFVDYDLALKKAVNRIREVLGDSAESPRFIETIPRRGYRFIAQVSGNGDAQAVAELPTEGTLTKTRRSRRNLQIGIVLGLGAAAFLLALLGLMPAKFWGRRSGATAAPQIRSLAVLPLRNLSSDPNQEYFSDGTTDALITDLAQISSLKVISHTSTLQYKDTKKSLPEIARELNVDGIVEGTVQRSGDRVRINAQLIYGPSDKHVWADSYEGDIRDMFALERDVTEKIAHQVQARLTTEKQVAPLHSRSLNPKVLEAYLQGSYHQDRYGEGAGDEELKEAQKSFQQAIDADPNFAPAYTGLAMAHMNLLWPSNQDFDIARRMAERAVELDSTFADARATLGWMKFEACNLPGAEEEFRHAIALNPNSADAHDDLGELLDVTGRLDEGWREHQIAQELDPNNDHLSDALDLRGQHDRAIAMRQMILNRHPDNGFLHYGLYKFYVQKEMYKEAIPELEKTFDLFGLPEPSSRIHRTFVSSGFRGAMRQSAEELESLAATKQAFLPVNLAEVYATLGDKDRAFYWLEQAYSHRDIHAASEDVSLYSLNTEFLLDPLHSDPRFKDLLRRIGLPQ